MVFLDFLVGSSIMVQPAAIGDKAISIEEAGVATSYEATKNISCGDIEWRVRWESRPAKGQISGGITVVIAGENKALPEAQAQIFDKFATIDSVSATCNESPNNGVTRSSLLVVGNARSGGMKALAQLNVGADFATNWSFDIVE